MVKRVKNPFIDSGYIGAEYFCDREKESAELTNSLLNGRNMVIISPRRMGKTGLIQHCFHQPKIRNTHYTFFIDIYATGSLRELVFIFGKKIFDTLKPKDKTFVDKFFAMVSSLRAAFKLDSVTGMPVFDIGISEIYQPERSLEEIFAYLESADKPCIVAIDEFQQIAGYPEKNIEAVMRTYIQQCKHTNFIFSGSQRHMMQNIFFSASRPFYQSAGLINLDPIKPEAYLSFAQKHFKKAGKIISDESIMRIYYLFEGHTWYMQHLLNRIYAQLDKGEEMTIQYADTILHNVVESYKTVYQGMLSTLSERQKEVLFAIGRQGKAKEITSARFVKKYGLNSASSVQSAIRQLLEKEFITREGDGYQVYDRFFGLWLSEMYGTGYKL